ncbi:MAG: accessory factor UbiK family protein [Rhodospirillales bacterium]
MQTNSRILEDLAKVASGAASTLVGVKQEVDALVRQRIERFAADLDLVTREEFEAVRAVATAARSAQERLERRVAELEARLGGTEPPAADPQQGA